MGYIDKVIVTITCDDCSIEETNSAKDSGSGWSGSSWGHLGPFHRFDVVMTYSEKMGNDVKSASCKKCGKPAKVDEHFAP